MNEYKVIIPEESYSILDFYRDKLPGIAVVNDALRKFEPKIVFSWHLSLIMDFKDLARNGMPSQKETKIIDPFCDYLDSAIKGSNSQKPNALFLARVTWNMTRRLVWYVYDPEPANKILQEIISSKRHPRPFDFRMEQDPEWKNAEWFLTEWPKGSSQIH